MGIGEKEKLAPDSPMDTMGGMGRTNQLSKKEEFRKHVAAIHTSGELSLVERKMTNVLLLNAYDSLLSRRTHKLPVAHLCAMVGWEGSNNVDRLKEALRRLVSTPVEFNVMEDGKEAWQVTSILSYGQIKDGTCTYRYDEYLAERLYDPEIYATINIGVQKRFSGNYSLTLYENCLRYKDVGSTGWWDVERFRKIVGAENSAYDEFKYLKRDVITKAVEEVNRVSDIRLEVEYRKEGRKVSEIRFLVKENPQQTLFKPNALEEYGEIREGETFKRLTECGIGERLAVAWILQDEERVRAVLDYAEEKDRKKLIKGSVAGYVRKVFEDGGELPADTEKKKREKAETARKKEAEEADLERLRTEFAAARRAEADAAVDALPEAELLRAFEGWKAEAKPPAPLLKGGTSSQMFRAWLRPKLVAKATDADFARWLKKRNAA